MGQVASGDPAASLDVVRGWTVDDVCTHVRGRRGFAGTADAFRKHGITGAQLLALDGEAAAELGLDAEQQRQLKLAQLRLGNPAAARSVWAEAPEAAAALADPDPDPDDQPDWLALRERAAQLPPLSFCLFCARPAQRCCQRRVRRIALDSMTAVDVGVVVGGRYRLRRLFRLEGMPTFTCRVWLASDDLNAGAEVMVKTPNISRELCQAAASPEELQLFVAHIGARLAREAMTAALAPASPYIARVLDHGVDLRGVVYLAQEWVPGRSLVQFVGTREMVPVADAMGMLRSAVAAVVALHEAGFVHGELRPYHFVTTETVRGVGAGICGSESDTDDDSDNEWGADVDMPLCRLVDFGPRKMGGPDERARELIAGPRFVTRYVGAELVRDPTRRPDAGADVWALGVMMAQLISGEAIEPSKTDGQMRVVNVARDRLLAAVPDDERFATGVLQLMAKCIEQRPEERISAAALLSNVTAMHRFLADQPPVPPAPIPGVVPAVPAVPPPEEEEAPPEEDGAAGAEADPAPEPSHNSNSKKKKKRKKAKKKAKKVDLKPSEGRALGLALVADAFSDLHDLRIGGMNLGTEGGCAVAEGLAAGKLPLLRTIDLSQNGMGLEAAHALVSTLRSDGCPKLERFIVAGNHFTAAGVEALVEALLEPATAPALVQLDARANGVGPALKARLLRRMQGVRPSFNLSL